MADLVVYDMEKRAVGKVEFPDPLKVRFNAPLVSSVVVGQLANRRRGTARVKNRHEVSGSTRKIYRQKGTGRARHGDIKAPIFVGGGRAFGPKPRDWSVTLPREIRRGALRSVIAQKEREGKLWVVDPLRFDPPKTKTAAGFFGQFALQNALVVLDEKSVAGERCIRNLPRFKACRVESVSLVDIMRYDHLVLTKSAYESLLSRVKRERQDAGV